MMDRPRTMPAGSASREGYQPKRARLRSVTGFSTKSWRRPFAYRSQPDGPLVSHGAAVFPGVGSPRQHSRLNVDADGLVAAELAGAVDEAMPFRRKLPAH